MVFLIILFHPIPDWNKKKIEVYKTQHKIKKQSSDTQPVGLDASHLHMAPLNPSSRQKEVKLSNISHKTGYKNVLKTSFTSSINVKCLHIEAWILGYQSYNEIYHRSYFLLKLYFFLNQFYTLKCTFRFWGAICQKYNISNLFIYETVPPKTCKHTLMWRIE